jgi:hypothetical protein
MSKIVYIWGSERPSARLKRLTKVLDKLFQDRKSELARHAAIIKSLDEAVAKIQKDRQQVSFLVQDGRYARTAEQDVLSQAGRSLKKRGRSCLKVIYKPAESVRDSEEISGGVPADSPRTREIPPERAELRARSPRRVKPRIDLSTFPSQLADAFPDHDMPAAPENEMTDEEKFAWLKRVRSSEDLEDDLRISKTVSGAFKRCFVFIRKRLSRERERRSVWEFVTAHVAYVAEFRRDIRRGTRPVEDAIAYLHDFDTKKVPNLTRGNEHQVYMEIITLLDDNIVAKPVVNSEQNATETKIERFTETGSEQSAVW